MEENKNNKDLLNTKTNITDQLKESIKLQVENWKTNNELLEAQKQSNEESKKNREMLDKKLKAVQERNLQLKKANDLEKSKQELINSKVVALNNIEVLVDETFQAVIDLTEKLQEMDQLLNQKVSNLDNNISAAEARTQQILLTVLEVLRQLPLFLNSKDSAKVEDNYNRLINILDKVSSKNVTVQNISADRDISLNQ